MTPDNGPSTVPGPFLLGDRVALRPLLEADLDGPYMSWFNDPEVCRWNSHHVYPYTREQALDYQRSARENGDLVLAIVDREHGVHLGNVALQEISALNRSAEFAIIVGDRAAWGTGIGTEAGRLVVDHGFQELNLHRIAAGTFAENEAMRRLARRLGMSEEGTRRQGLFKHGAYRDIIEYGILVDEWRAHQR